MTEETNDTVKLGIGLVATMTALILGLVMASTKNSFDALDTSIKHTASNVLALDRILARYGPETSGIRAALKRDLGHKIELIWHEGNFLPGSIDSGKSEAGEAEGLDLQILRLNPANDGQRRLQTRAMVLSEGLLEERWNLVLNLATTVPTAFLVILFFWLTIIFASFGLFAPQNGTVVAVLILCALSVAGAVFLILEMEQPFDGLIRIGSEPLRYAYERLNK